VDYTDAVTILENCGEKFENPVYWGVDLSSEHERYLAEEALQSAGGREKLPERH
jgi:asparaginyl-tRNA synthetase